MVSARRKNHERAAKGGGFRGPKPFRKQANKPVRPEQSKSNDKEQTSPQGKKANDKENNCAWGFGSFIHFGVCSFGASGTHTPVNSPLLRTSPSLPPLTPSHCLFQVLLLLGRAGARGGARGPSCPPPGATANISTAPGGGPAPHAATTPHGASSVVLAGA